MDDSLQQYARTQKSLHDDKMNVLAAPASGSIVCYRHSAAQVERLLASVAHTPALRLYLIDNSATDTLAGLARRFGVRYVHQPHNPGFGRAHNLAMRDAMEQGCRYHFVFDPGIEFGEDVLACLLNYMEEHADIAMLAPRVHYPDGTLQQLCKLLPSPVDLLARRLCPPLYRRSGRKARYELHASGYNEIMDVPALSGCCMLLRSAALAQAGLFDERFFLYCEDVDLSRRIRRVGRTVYFPYVHIVHEYERGSYRDWPLLWHHVVSAVRYFNKWGWIADHERRRVNRVCLRRLARKASMVDAVAGRS